MKPAERQLTRRSFVIGAIATTLTAAPALRSVSAAPGSQPSPAIQAVKVGQVPVEPADAAWTAAPSFEVAMLPQMVTLPRVTEASAKVLQVRALFDNQRLAIRVEWPDVHRDTDLGKVTEYRDGVAVMFAEDPSLGVPPITMGSPDSPVSIYHWKSDWQLGPLRDVDDAYPNMYSDWYMYSGVAAGGMAEASDYLTKGRKEYLPAAAAGNMLADPLAQGRVGPVERLRALGFGTLEPQQVQDGAGKGVFQNAGWNVILSVPLKQDKFTLAEGGTLPVAFAAWDGSRNERDGQKAYSVWQNLQLGAPVPGVTPTSTPMATPTAVPAGSSVGRNVGIAGAAALAVAAGWIAIVALRIRRMGKQGGRG